MGLRIHEGMDLGVLTYCYDGGQDLCDRGFRVATVVDEDHRDFGQLMSCVTSIGSMSCGKGDEVEEKGSMGLSVQLVEGVDEITIHLVEEPKRGALPHMKLEDKEVEYCYNQCYTLPYDQESRLGWEEVLV